jgi:hypothetical protein
MTIVRTTLATMPAVVLFASLALALASPPNGNPAGGCGQGPPSGVGGGPPGGQYGRPPGGQYGGPPAPPTFGLSHDGFLGAYLRHLVVGAVAAGFTVVLLAGFVEDLGLDPRPAQALALTLLVPLFFVLSRRFAFRLRPDAA